MNIFHAIWWASDGRLFFTTRDGSQSQRASSLWDIRVDIETGKPLSQPRRIHRYEDEDALVLNATADGRRLVVELFAFQDDVYVGQLEANGQRLKDLRRLTFDERSDYAATWMPDSKAVLFHSDRNGQYDIFKQALDQDTAEPIATGSSNKYDPAVSPDGAWILYLQVGEGKSRIMRVPVAGGPQQSVLESQGIGDVMCSRSPSTLCVIDEMSPDSKQVIFTAFDPAKGRGRELARVDLAQPVGQYYWSPSPDGSRLAFAQRGQDRHI